MIIREMVCSLWGIYVISSQDFSESKPILTLKVNLKKTICQLQGMT